MIYLEKESSALYLEASRFCFHTGNLSWTHYLDRMAALKNMCEPDDPVFSRANKLLIVEEWEDEDQWTDEESQRHFIPSSGDEPIGGSEVKPGLHRNKKGFFQFLSRKKGLASWVFHQYDVDFHPSIPHGHLNGKNHSKLDAYLGWIYKGTKQIDRLSRNLIIELWNDDEFRLFAYRAIDWYTGEFPSYKWRVNNPLLLPRRK